MIDRHDFTYRRPMRGGRILPAPDPEPELSWEERLPQLLADLTGDASDVTRSSASRALQRMAEQADRYEGCSK